MLTYILRRLPQTILVILGVTLITFIALQVGGDPTYLFVSERASLEEIELTRIKLGFDKPLYIQYLSYLYNIIRLDFGDSLYFRQPAMDVIFETLPATIELTVFAMLIAVFGAIPFGIFAAIKRGVHPFLSAICKYVSRSSFDNPSNNSFMTSTWPCFTATKRGVRPSFSALCK